MWLSHGSVSLLTRMTREAAESYQVFTYGQRASPAKHHRLCRNWSHQTIDASARADAYSAQLADKSVTQLKVCPTEGHTKRVRLRAATVELSESDRCVKRSATWPRPLSPSDAARQRCE